MDRKRFAPPVQILRHNANFRPDFFGEGPNPSPDGQEIIPWEGFTDQGNPTAVFAPVIREQGGTWIQYSGSVHHDRQHLTTDPPRKEGPGD
jgi:hypothetical protein